MKNPNLILFGMLLPATFAIGFAYSQRATSDRKSPTVREEKIISLASPDVLPTQSGNDARWEVLNAPLKSMTMGRRVDAIQDALAEIKPEDAQAMLAALPAGLSRRERMVWISGLLSLWSEVDPAGAVLAAQAYTEIPSYEKHGLFAVWSKKDADAALAFAKKLPEGREQQGAISGVLSGMIHSQPERALDLAEELLGDNMEYDNTSHLYGAYAQKHPAAALARALKRKVVPENDRALLSIAQEWAKKDISAARAAWQAMKEGVQRDSFLAGTVMGWMRDNPEAAGQFLAPLLPKGMNEMKWEHPLMRSSHEFSRTMYEDRTLFPRFLAQLPDGEFKRQLTQSDLQQRMQTDPNGVWSEINRLPPSQERTNTFSNTLNGLIHNQPEQAMQFARTLNAEEQKHILPNLIQNWAYQDYSAALAYARASGQPELLDRVYDGIGNSLSQRAPEQAEAVLNGIPEPQRTKVMQNYLGGMAQNDPQSAWDYLQAHIPAAQQPAVIQQAAQQLSWSQPALAAEWADQLAEGEERVNAFSNVSRAWSGNASVDVTKWLATLDPSPSRDAAVEQFVNAARGYDAERAVQWAVTISDSSKLRSSLPAAWKAWKSHSPAEAQAWASSANLPAEISALLKP